VQNLLVTAMLESVGHTRMWRAFASVGQWMVRPEGQP
jgi:hypothetical protein